VGVNEIRNNSGNGGRRPGLRPRQKAPGDYSPRENGRHWWAWLRLILLGLALATVTGLVMVQPLLPTGQVMLEVDEVAPETIRAPYPLAYDSVIRQEEERERAAARVEPIFSSPQGDLARQQLERARAVLDYLGSVRADSLASTAQKRAWVLVVPELDTLTPDAIDSLLALSNQSWDRVQLETLAVIAQAMRQEIREGEVEEARRGVPRMIGLDLSDEEATVAAVLAQSFMVANSFLDPAATADAQARAREEVGPVTRRFEAGQVIVREGNPVDELDVEVLDQFGLRQPRTKWIEFAGAGGLAVLQVAMLYLYLARFAPDAVWKGQQPLLLALLTVIFVVGSGLMVPAGGVLRYLAPAPALAMLLTAMLGRHAGAASAIFLGAVTGVIADNSLEMAIYAAMGGLIAALALGRVERIGEMFRAGAFVALGHVGVLAIFYLVEDAAQPTELAASALTGVVNGGLSSSLALGGLFLISPLFDIVTTMRLIELSRPEHPLLQRMLREAPATYHHSLMVANLAEQGAESIDANALLARVGAYYHDIGKVERPYFFAENQAEGFNPHDRMDPDTSAEILVGHVTDGLKLARSYHLPSRVRAFIPEHHGGSRVSFLYHKAVQLAGDAELVDEGAFRYPGRRPQSKETALVMLADGCEAAVRSARPEDADQVAEIVNRIIDQRIEDGQLNDSGLTLNDVEIIRQVFASGLKGTFHPRIKYPEPKGKDRTAIGTEVGAGANV
jgi:putative nucleotidyltransferase with HDIG domain